MPAKVLGGTRADGYSGSTTRQFYFPFGFGGFPGTTGSIGILPTQVTAKNFRVKLENAPGAGVTMQWRLTNFVGTAGLSVDISDSETTAVDLGVEHWPPFTQGVGDRVQVSSQRTAGGAPVASKAYWSYDVVPAIADEQVLFASTGLNAFSDKRYMSFAGSNIAGTPEFAHAIVIPTAGTIKKLYVLTLVDPGIGSSWACTVRKNAGATSLVATPTGTGSLDAFDSDTVNSFTVAAGDLIALECDPINAPNGTQMRAAIVFVPDAVGEMIIPATGFTTNINTGARYHRVWTPDAADNESAESNAREMADVAASRMVITRIEVVHESTSGAFSNYTYTLMQNGIPSELDVTLTGAGLTGFGTGNVVVGAEDLFSTRVVPTRKFGDPLAIRAHVTYLAEMAVPTVHILGGNILDGTIL